MNETRLRRFLLYFTAAAALALTVYLALRYALRALFPFLLAAALAAAVEPAVSFGVKRLHLRRGFCAAAATLFLLFLLGGLASFFAATLVMQGKTLLSRLPLQLDALTQPGAKMAQRLARLLSAAPLWLQEYVSDFFADFGAALSAALRAFGAWALAKLGSFAAALPRTVLTAATSVLAVFFTSLSFPTLRESAKRLFPSAQLSATLRSVRQTLLRWLRAQGILFSLTFSELFLGFTLLGSDVALLLAFLTALVDLLPVLGTGTVLLPWALAALLGGNALRAIGLAALYLLTLSVRSVTEPKLLASLAGVPPIVSLAAMYLGFCLLGVTGMVLFPLFLILGVNLFRAKKEGQKAAIKKTSSF